MYLVIYIYKLVYIVIYTYVHISNITIVIYSKYIFIYKIHI